MEEEETLRARVREWGDELIWMMRRVRARSVLGNFFRRRHTEMYCDTLTRHTTETLARQRQELEALDARLQEREREIAHREQDHAQLSQCLREFQQTVHLNVGGTKFQTTISTLSRVDGMLSRMFSGRHALHTDGDGCVFIDRDGTHFRLILNFLRTGRQTWPRSRDAADEFIDELDYYGLLEAYDTA